MLKKALLSLSAALPIAALVVSSALAQPPKATGLVAYTAPVVASRPGIIIIEWVIEHIVVTDIPVFSSSGLEAKSSVEAAKSLDS